MTISAYAAPIPKLQFTDSSGNFLSGGLLYIYTAGSTTKATTYQDATLSTPNTNPVVLDSEGRCTVFLLPGNFYKFVLAPSTDTDPPTNPIWTVDNIGSPASGTPYAVDTGAVNTLVAASVVGIPLTRTPGTSINIKAANTATGPCSLEVTPAGGTSYGAISIRDKTGAVMIANSFVAGQVMLLTDDGTYWRTQF